MTHYPESNKRFYIFSWFCAKRSTSCFMLNTVSWSICKVHSEGFFWTWIIYIQPSKSSIQHRQIKDKGRHSLCMIRYSHAMDPLEEVPQLLGLHLMAQSLYQAVGDCHFSLCNTMNHEKCQSWSQNKIMIFKIFYGSFTFMAEAPIRTSSWFGWKCLLALSSHLRHYQY